jgi:hypothetical protein
MTLSSTTSNSASDKLPNTSRDSASNRPRMQACKQTHPYTYIIASGTNTNVLFSDGRDVMSYAQLWAVPDDVVAREPIVTTSETKIPRKLLAHDKRAECVSHICDEEADCYEYNCARCIRVTECVGGPTSCLSSKTCHFNR